MNTNIVIDDALMRRAMEISGIQSEDEVMRAAVSEFVDRRARLDLRDLRGKISFFDGYDYKASREKDAL
jgi:Arc/MetJ family transcription regulator